MLLYIEKNPLMQQSQWNNPGHGSEHELNYQKMFNATRVTDRFDAQKTSIKNITRDKNQIPLTSYWSRKRSMKKQT
jgi:hypothetical protein